MKWKIGIAGMAMLFFVFGCGESGPSAVTKEDAQNKADAEVSQGINQIKETAEPVPLDPGSSDFQPAALLGDQGVRGFSDVSSLPGVDMASAFSMFTQSGSSLSPPAVLGMTKKALKIKPLQEVIEDPFDLTTYCGNAVQVDTDCYDTTYSSSSCTYMIIKFDGSCDVQGAHIEGKAYVEIRIKGENSGTFIVNADLNGTDDLGNSFHFVAVIYVDGSYDPATEEVNLDLAYYQLQDTSEGYYEEAAKGTVQTSYTNSSTYPDYYIDLEYGSMDCPVNWTDITDCYMAEYGVVDNLWVKDASDYGFTIDGFLENAWWNGTEGGYGSVDFDSVVMDYANCYYSSLLEDNEPFDGSVTLSNGVDTLQLDFSDQICTDGCPAAVIYNGVDVTDAVCGS